MLQTEPRSGERIPPVPWARSRASGDAFSGQRFSSSGSSFGALPGQARVALTWLRLGCGSCRNLPRSANARVRKYWSGVIPGAIPKLRAERSGGRGDEAGPVARAVELQADERRAVRGVVTRPQHFGPRLPRYQRYSRRDHRNSVNRLLRRSSPYRLFGIAPSMRPGMISSVIPTNEDGDAGESSHCEGP